MSSIERQWLLNYSNMLIWTEFHRTVDSRLCFFLWGLSLEFSLQRNVGHRTGKTRQLQLGTFAVAEGTSGANNYNVDWGLWSGGTFAFSKQNKKWLEFTTLQGTIYSAHNNSDLMLCYLLRHSWQVISWPNGIFMMPTFCRKIGRAILHFVCKRRSPTGGTSPY